MLGAAVGGGKVAQAPTPALAFACMVRVWGPEWAVEDTSCSLETAAVRVSETEMSGSVLKSSVCLLISLCSK